MSLHFVAGNFIPKELCCRVVMVRSDRVPSCTSRAAGTGCHRASVTAEPGKPTHSNQPGIPHCSSSHSRGCLPCTTQSDKPELPDLHLLPFLPGVRGRAVGCELCRVRATSPSRIWGVQSWGHLATCPTVPALSSSPFLRGRAPH